MTPAAQESFKQRHKFTTVKKNAKRWSKKGSASSSSGPPAKKAKSGAVNMITTQSNAFEDEGSAERPSKKARFTSSTVDDAE